MAKKTKKKSNAGRKSKFDSRFPLMAAKLAAEGKNNKEIAEFFGVSESTFYRWLEANTEFWESLKGAKDEADELVIASLFKRAVGFTVPETKVFMSKDGKIVTHEMMKHYAPDTTAAIFWLKNRKRDAWGEGAEGDTNVNITLGYRPRSQRDGSGSDSE